MADAGSALSRHDLEAKIVRRCWEDEAFRREFTADPAGSFVKYLEVPKGSLPRITVHQEEPGSWHIVLPARPASTAELSEEDLEKISGGSTPACVIGVSAVATAVLGSAVVSGGVTVSAYVVSVKEGGW
jgi:hypothetical protein